MTAPPRWFYPFVAACLVALTAGACSWLMNAGRYSAVQVGSTIGVLNTRTGLVCFPSLSCRDLSRPTPASRPANP